MTTIEQPDHLDQVLQARTETFTAPTLEYAAPVECDCQCARCGSSCGWIDCSDCLHGVITTEDDEGFDVVEHCSTCGGCGGWWCCLSSAEWCAANPVPGREHVARGSVEWFDVPADTSTSERRPDPIRACPCCGDDAELVGAPGPNEPTDEYVCSSCDCNFTSDGTITFVSDECASRAATSTNRDDDGR